MKYLAPLLVLAALLFSLPAPAHDHEHPEQDAWYKSLKMPDLPTSSCCGEADAYWCDDYYARGDKAYCKITDDRVVPGRPPIAVGMEFEIPAHKLKYSDGNPTGHAVVFLSTSGLVYCFVQGTGI